jgi:hypothetical protein
MPSNVKANYWTMVSSILWYQSARRAALTIVLTSPMDGSPQVVRFDATTLWHFDAAEWAPSTASNSQFYIP